MLSRERLEELRQSANAAEVEIPQWAVAWTEAEARAFFETGGAKLPSLDVPPNDSDAATQALTVACEKLSIVYRDEPVLKGKLTKGVLIGTGGTALVWLATHKESGQKLALKQLFKTNVAKFGTLGAQLAFREQEAYKAFASPFIVRCFGCFQDNLCLCARLPWLCMDCCSCYCRPAPRPAAGTRFLSSACATSSSSVRRRAAASVISAPNPPTHPASPEPSFDPPRRAARGVVALLYCERCAGASAYPPHRYTTTTNGRRLICCASLFVRILICARRCPRRLRVPRPQAREHHGSGEWLRQANRPRFGQAGRWRKAHVPCAGTRVPD